MTHQHRCPNIHELKVLLKRHSLKATPQRIAVHQAMLDLGHASADMVSEYIEKIGVKITAASVYNILSQMSMLGIYKYRLSANNKMYFDVNNFDHIHLYDIDNHLYKDVIDDDLMEIIKARLGKKRFRGYNIESIDIQIIGKPAKRKYSV